MSTKYYEWGNTIAGGGEAVVPAEASYGPPEDFSGTIIAAATETITFSSATKSVKIQNTHDSASFTFSVDGGVTFRTMGAYGEIEEPIEINYVVIVGGASNSSYYVRGTLTE